MTKQINLKERNDYPQELKVVTIKRAYLAYLKFLSVRVPRQ